MQLVQIDVIRSQSPEAVFRCGTDVLRLRTQVLVIHAHAELRRYQYLGSVGAKSSPEQLLAAPAAAINVGCIKKVDTRIKRSVDHSARSRFIKPTAKIIAAQSNNGNPERSDSSSVHE